MPDSKRSVLSAIARLYDPLGWVTPVTIKIKIFMQTLWRVKVGWDEALPPTLLHEWKGIYTRLASLGELQINRWTAFENNTQTIELHGFCDTSNSAYAAAVYLKVVTRSGVTTITLLIGKSRVSPMTPVSIPRLELSGALLLSQLVKFVRESLALARVPCYCWTDSTVVLAWVTQHPSRWKLFVANRVAEIQARLPQVEWRHVPSESNPADCASRGLYGDELRTHTLWWEGPSWLQLPRETWPISYLCDPEETPLEERVVVAHTSEPPPCLDLASRWSSWPKLIRITAYLFRFVHRCRRSHLPDASPEFPIKGLAPVECSFARSYWIRVIQATVFRAELAALSRGHQVSSKSSIHALRPFLDPSGILRVGGRLRNAPFPPSRHQPILLAAHPLVTQIIEQGHTRSLHGGLQLTLSTLRQEFWILRARSLVRHVIHKCVVCAKERADTPSQIMGDLPDVRVRSPKRCFEHSGVDYAGPVWIRTSAGRGIRPRKAYIALFICLATRALHLELVTDCSTASFINAFSRFCARRGLPSSMYSDNGTTFVGADRELRNAFRSAIRDPNFLSKTAMDNITWNFIPPSAPHFGGLWEAGVKSVKYHLRRALGNHTLTYEEFSTFLCQVEACLNSRPIAPLTDSCDDFEFLTPGHFLIGTPITAIPEPSVLDIHENRLSRWQLIRRLTELFWHKWYNDYVNTLQQRGKWRAEQPAIRVGRLVLLRNNTLPPCKWELGRVTRCHPGPDGFTRVVTIRTASSEYKRPIVKLCLLPVECENQ